MYDFHYNYMLKKYVKKNIKLMYDFHYNYMLKNMSRKILNLYLQTQTVFVIKFMMFIKIYFKMKNYLIILITQKTMSSFWWK